jgi:hypothetical protein
MLQISAVISVTVPNAHMTRAPTELFMSPYSSANCANPYLAFGEISSRQYLINTRASKRVRVRPCFSSSIESRHSKDDWDEGEADADADSASLEIVSNSVEVAWKEVCRFRHSRQKNKPDSSSLRNSDIVTEEDAENEYWPPLWDNFIIIPIPTCIPIRESAL